MGNFFSGVYQNLFQKAPGGDTPYSDPLGYGFYADEQKDEEEKKRKAAEAEAARLQGQLQGKIRDVLNLHSTALPTSGDLRGAARRDLAQQRARKGRESTILTGDILGGGG